jgi:aminoglycoside phosphotransferase (APT) family kinase protein
MFLGGSVSEAAALDAASLQRFLSAVESDRGPTVTSFRPISGGYSRLSALASIRWSDGSEETFVLRADPPPETGVFESDRDDEWRLLRSLHGKLAVHSPNARWYDSTGEYFGQKTLIVDFFAGRPLPDVVASDGVEKATEIFVDTIAKLHTTPLDVMPAEMTRPRDWDSYIDDLVGLLGRLDNAVSDSSPALHYAAAQLKAHRPAPMPLTLVHGDCQPANVLVPDEGPVLMIDWEFCRIGDPREDLGYYSHLPVPPNLFEADPESFLSQYRAKTGFTEEQVNPETLGYFYVLGMARLLGQMFVAADALHKGHPRGVMATYMMNGTAATTRAFVDIAQRLAG